MTSYLILMDLLYNNQQYEQVMHVMDSFVQQRFEFGSACTTIAIAACNKLVSLATSKSLADFFVYSLMITVSNTLQIMAVSHAATGTHIFNNHFPLSVTWLPHQFYSYCCFRPMLLSYRLLYHHTVLCFPQLKPLV